MDQLAMDWDAEPQPTPPPPTRELTLEDCHCRIKYIGDWPQTYFRPGCPLHPVTGA